MITSAKALSTTLSLLLLLTALLAACAGSTPPPLAEPGQPTLVFIYTEA